MSTITLIATGHKEKGLCNSQELFKIIEQISPDVIFEEVPPCKFEAVYAGNLQTTLEVETIKAYLQKHPEVHHYPVDLNIEEATEKEIRQELNGMSIIFNDYSPGYNNLSNQISSLSEIYGFSFLNSDRYSELLLRKKFLEKQILDALKTDDNQKTLDHEGLDLAYKLWIEQNDDRENEMLRNIYIYMEQKKYTRALFLVGAAHRKPIMQKIQEKEQNEKFKLHWTFYTEFTSPKAAP